MHLFIVCTAPCSAGKVVLANVSSWKDDRCDGTVKLGAGEHPWLNVPSYVAYNFSEVERVITVEAGIRLGRFVQRDNFPEPRLSDIEAGLLQSRFTPRKVKKYVRARV